LTFFPPALAGVDAFCLIFDIISNMAGVGLLSDDVSAVCFQGFAGSGNSSKEAMNFCFTRFD
jgi:hypothetical protein